MRVRLPPNCGWRSQAGTCKVARVDPVLDSPVISIPAQVLVLARGRPVRVSGTMASAVSRANTARVTDCVP